VATITDTPWMTNEEVAAYAKVPLETVRAWRYRGVGPIGHRVGRHVRYHRDDVDNWMRSGDTGRLTDATA
jgi:excisionase family DNA binding protein